MVQGETLPQGPKEDARMLKQEEAQKRLAVSTQGELAATSQESWITTGQAQYLKLRNAAVSNIASLTETMPPEQKQERAKSVLASHKAKLDGVPKSKLLSKAIREHLIDIEKNLAETAQWVPNKKRMGYLNKNGYLNWPKIRKAIEGLPSGDHALSLDREVMLYRSTLEEAMFQLDPRGAPLYFSPEKTMVRACIDRSNLKHMGFFAGKLLAIGVGAMWSIDGYKKYAKGETPSFWIPVSFGMAMALHNPKKFMNSFSKAGVSENYVDRIQFLTQDEFAGSFHSSGSIEYAKQIMALSPSKRGIAFKTLLKYSSDETHATVKELTHPKGKALNGISPNLAEWLVSLPPWNAMFVVQQLGKGSGTGELARNTHTSIINYLTGNNDPQVASEYRKLTKQAKS